MAPGCPSVPLSGGYSKLVTIGPPAVTRLLDSDVDADIEQILADGRALGTQSLERFALWRVDLKGTAQEPERVSTIPRSDRNLCLSPDGQMLAFETNRAGREQIWVSRSDGNGAHALASAVPPSGSFGENTVVDGISWSPDGKWIAWSIDPGLGHGVDDARVFLVPAAGGVIRKLVDLCSQDRDAPLGRPIASRSLFPRKIKITSRRSFEWISPMASRRR